MLPNLLQSMARTSARLAAVPPASSMKMKRMSSVGTVAPKRYLPVIINQRKLKWLIKLPGNIALAQRILLAAVAGFVFDGQLSWRQTDQQVTVTNAIRQEPKTCTRIARTAGGRGRRTNDFEHKSAGLDPLKDPRHRAATTVRVGPGRTPNAILRPLLQTKPPCRLAHTTLVTFFSCSRLGC